MAIAMLQKLIDDAAIEPEPSLIGELDINPGGVDPLGLRQINFQMMDTVLPGLNNVARHIRPYTVIAWAWRRSLMSARALGTQKIELSDLLDFVDRIEVLYVWSQLLRDQASDLPGREFLSRLSRDESYIFGGAQWKSLREQRRYSTALSAPVNYGPAVKTLGWIIPSPIYRGAFVSSERVGRALDALDRQLGNHLEHPVFNLVGSVEITRDEASRIGGAWALEELTEEERDAMRSALTSKAHAESLDKTVRCIIEASRFGKSSDSAELRELLSGEPLKFRSSESLHDVQSKWRAIQLRQLFRLSLEALLHWTTLQLTDGPMTTEELTRKFQGERLQNVSTSSWLDPSSFAPASIPARIDALQEVLDESKDLEDVAAMIHQGLVISLDGDYEADQEYSSDRLPLARAQIEVSAFCNLPASAFIRHVLDSWVLGQHAYWAIGRGLGDARNGGKTLLRLKVVMDEGGWRLTPGVNLGSAPRATPDRLQTAVSLMSESALI